MQRSFRDHHILSALAEWESGTLPLDFALYRYYRSHKALGSKDRRAIGEAIYGMVRWKLRLDWAHQGRPSWESRLARWRRFDPTKEKASLPPHIECSMPEWLFSRMVLAYGEAEALRLGMVSNTEAPLTIRINPEKVRREELLLLWKDLGVEEGSHSEWAIRFPRRCNLFDLQEYRRGWFEVQDEASQQVAALVEAVPGEQVLDYCAGSGGKSLAFAHRMEGRGQLHLHDVRASALKQARQRFARAGIQNVQYHVNEPISLQPCKRKMDWVVVDAPCSGTGTLRRNPDMKWRLCEEDLLDFIAKQQNIFQKSLSFLRPGGRIVYATCSLLKEENQQQLDFFLRSFPLHLVGKPFATQPEVGGRDGMFAAVMEYCP